MLSWSKCCPAFCSFSSSISFFLVFPVLNLLPDVFSLCLLLHSLLHLPFCFILFLHCFLRYSFSSPFTSGPIRIEMDACKLHNKCVGAWSADSLTGTLTKNGLGECVPHFLAEEFDLDAFRQIKTAGDLTLNSGQPFVPDHFHERILELAKALRSAAL